ncbi:MAG: CRTAC1 family protein [Saprospiraceae bacterium]|nr:CRTAC1 family protein [Saprospiraceae bacterium]
MSIFKNHRLFQPESYYRTGNSALNHFLGVLLPIFILMVIGCKPDETHIHHQHTDHDSASGAVNAETIAMIDSVQKAQASVDPMKVTVFMSGERAKLLQKRVESTNGLDKVNFMVMWGFEELKAGNTESAITIFQNVLKMVEPMQIPGKEQTVLEMKKLLALGALRLGEQQNCIINHTTASCIIPIAPAGQHSKKEGSTLAMEIYQDILRQTPDDLTSRYLFNVAAMTLGKFPEGVPARFRLPKEYYTSKVDFPRFTDIAFNLGLDTRGLAGGVAVEDFNNDGHLDIMSSNWGFHDQIHLYQNKGDGSFEDVTLKSGLQGITGGLNIRQTDYNNDGFADVLVMRGAWFRDQGRIPNSLLKNNGDGTFTDVTVTAGIYTKRPTQNAVWADFDLDGWLDLFIGNEAVPEGGSAFYFPSELYHNQRDGTFKEVSAAANLQINAFVKGSTGGDINNDGFPDLYISVLNGNNRLFLNESDDSGIKFRDISATANVGEPYVSFPTWMFDYNNDGWLDIFVSAYSDGSEDLPGKVLRAYGKKNDPFRPRLYRNNGNYTFTDMSIEMGLTEPVFSMGSNYGDLDNDGYPDFYLGTGEPNLKSIVPNKMYWNREGKSYADITYAGGFGNIQKGHGVGFGDMDQDGDQDFYVRMGGSFEGDVYQSIFFENPMPHENRWIVLRLEGVLSNRLAIGARVEIEITESGNTRKIYEMVSPGSSFGGNSLQLEIGLGKAESIQSAKIYWPNKKRTVQDVSGLSLDKAYRIKEGGEPELVEYTMTPFKKEAGHHH